MASQASDLIFTALRDTGLPFEIKRTKGHAKIVLAGRLVGVTRVAGNKDTDLRAAKNVVSQIRRAAAGLASA